MVIRAALLIGCVGAHGYICQVERNLAAIIMSATIIKHAIRCQIDRGVEHSGSHSCSDDSQAREIDGEHFLRVQDSPYEILHVYRVVCIVNFLVPRHKLSVRKVSPIPKFASRQTDLSNGPCAFASSLDGTTDAKEIITEPTPDSDKSRRPVARTCLQRDRYVFARDAFFFEATRRRFGLGCALLPPFCAALLLALDLMWWQEHAKSGPRRPKDEEEGCSPCLGATSSSLPRSHGGEADDEDTAAREASARPAAPVATNGATTAAHGGHRIHEWRLGSGGLSPLLSPAAYMLKKPPSVSLDADADDEPEGMDTP